MKDKTPPLPIITKGFFLLFFSLFLLLGPFLSSAQTPGMIFQKALNPGPTTLDPNNDGYVSKFSTGFVGTADMGTNSEIPFRFLPQMPTPNSPEPLADLTTGSSGGHTDLADVPLGVYYNGADLIFRMRVGGSSTASKGYSFLLDTDNVFNKIKKANGTLIDYTTPSQVTNLGFEYEVVLALNFDVIIYRHKGSGDANDPKTSTIIWRGSANGGYNKYFQKSVAASLAGGNTDYFFDYYVPLSAFSSDGGPGISPTTPLRMSGSTVTSAQTGLDGTISDIGGVNDTKFGNDKLKIWNQLISAFPPTTPLQIQNGDFCTAPAPAAPVISTSPIRTTTTTVTGTSSENGGTIRFYRNGVEVLATYPVTISNGGWSNTLPTGTSFAAGDKISVKVTRAATETCPELTSVSSNTVTVVSPAAPTISNCNTTAPVITGISGKDIVSGTTIYPGATITIYKDGTRLAYTTLSGTTGTTTGGVTTYSWSYDDPTLKNNGLAYPPGGNGNQSTYANIVATVTPSGQCESSRSNSYYTNTDSATPTTGTTTNSSTDAPIISNAFICSTTTTISGTREANANIYLYVNGFAVTTTSDGSNAPTPISSTSTTTWSIDLTQYVIPANARIYVKAMAPNANYPSGYEGLSASSAEIIYGANCQTAAPVISTTAPCPTATVISGTLAEANNSLVTVYKRVGTSIDKALDVRITNAATVTGNNWSASILTGYSPKAGDVLYAFATAPDKTQSENSNLITVATPGTASSFGLVLNPIKERAATITGTATTTGTVSVYIDGIRIAGTASVTASGTTPVAWSIDITSANQLNLSTGVQVTASILPASGCESQQTAPVVVSCNEPSKNPSISTAPQTICRGGIATITINGSEDGVVYQIYNGDTPSGPSVAGDATLTTITLKSAPLNSTASLTVRAYRVGTSGCQVTLNGTSIVTVNPGPTAFSVSPTSLNVCSGSTATVTLAGSEVGVTYQVQVYDPNTNTYINSGSTISGTGNSLQLTSAALTSGGTFKVIATGSSCSVDMGNTFSVFVPMKSLAITPTSRSICNGVTASVTVRGSQSGVTYRIYNGSTPSGLAVPGNGGDIILTTDAVSTTGTTTFKIVATPDVLSSCPVDLTQTFAVTVTPTLATPTISLTSSTTLCGGGTANIKVTGSQLGVYYQIYNGNYASGATVIGTGGDITLTSATLSSNSSLTVKASNSCGTSLSSSAVAVTVSTIAAYTLSPTNTTICSNSPATITLAATEPGTTYTLKYFDSVTRTYKDFSTVVAATTSSTASGSLTLNSPNLTASTTLKVVATRNGCSQDMVNTVDVSVPSTTINLTPMAQTICTGSTASVTILSSQIGVTYQLQVITGTNTYTSSGASVVGNGSDIVLTSVAAGAGTSGALVAETNNLRVWATPVGCTAFPSSTFTVIVSAPTVQTVTLTSPASICSGRTSTLSLSSSQAGITYQIFNGTTPTGYPVQGTGSSITLTTEPLTSTATLKVVAIKAGCGNVDMSGTPTVTVTTPPAPFTVSPTSQTICTNGTAQVTLSGSQNGVTYQLYNGLTPTGASMPSTGGQITLTSGSLTANATLTVVASSAGGCGNVTMNGFSSVFIIAAPSLTTSSQTSFCGSGTTFIRVTNPVVGASYKLYKDGSSTPVATINYSGSGTVDFYLNVTASSTYTVRASNGTCEVASPSTFSYTVTDCTPLKYDVQPTYNLSTYVYEEVVAKPIQAFTGRVYTYALKSGSLLSGTSVDQATGKIYVSNLLKLGAGTTTVTITSTSTNGQATDVPVTYSISPDGNTTAAQRTSSPETLPVELVTFKAENVEGAVVLSWTTASEKDNERFEVERSLDAKTFTKIGQIAGAGTSNILKTYTYKDVAPVTGTAYYRLKQVDLDGKFEYSKLISLKTESQAVQTASMSVAPNPFSQTVSLTLTSNQEGTVQLEIYSLQAKSVLHEIVKLSSGTTLLQRDLHNLPAGVYILRVNGAGINVSQKIIKVD